MRAVILALLVTAAAVGPALGDDARTTLGDIPRTYSHYLNAQEAALCRANAATGGLASYFLNPAMVTEVEGVAGQATMRYNVKSRDYLPDGAEHLDATDDGFLLTQFVAVKRSGSLVLGFGYSSPSYRDLQITGQREYGRELKGFEGLYSGALRYFEIIGGARIGDHQQGGLGVTVGIVNLSEEVRERIAAEELNTARVDGIATCFAIGFGFDVTDRVTIGLGHRLSSTISVDGEHYEKPAPAGESTTQPTTVAGVRIRPTDSVTVHASYVQDGWDRVKSSLAAYEEAYGEDAWKPFDEPISTVAVGAEVAFAEGKAIVRAGYSMELGAGIDDAIVPESSIGVGGSVRFDHYIGELAVVRETFM